MSNGEGGKRLNDNANRRLSDEDKRKSGNNKRVRPSGKGANRLDNAHVRPSGKGRRNG